MKRCFWLILFVGMILGRTAFGCRYNVRETGFVDLGADPYVLCGYVDGNTPADVKAAFKRAAEAGLAESNVVFRLIDLDEQKDHPAVEHFDPNTQAVPCAVLISPDGQTKAIDVGRAGEGFDKSVSSAVKRILNSPVRSRLLAEAAKMYGVIMVMEGPKIEENKKAGKEAAAAVELVKSQMEYMPKEVANPPSFIVADANSLADEEILLWSLGIEAKDVNEPLAIIVYGRGRWIGPVFRGGQVNEEDLAGILFVVGADCECGMDYRWLQGTMVPAKWDRKLHELAVESLGFDPESPMIKMEMASIIGRGMGGYQYPGTPMGYQELIIEPADDFDEQPMNVEQPLSENSSEPDVVLEPIEAPDDVNVEKAADEPNIEEKIVVEDANDTATEGKADARAAEEAKDAGREKKPVDHSAGDVPDPNVLRSLFKESQRQDGKATDEDVFRSVRSLAMLTIGLLAFVLICGIAILARARRLR